MPNGKVIIRDLVVVSASKTGEKPTGEAGQSGEIGTTLTSDQLDVVPRLTNFIHELIDIAVLDHQTQNATKDLDYITRLSTHEFFFYTQKPLSLIEFEILQNNIAFKLKNTPPGIQLILGSFAVKNDNDEIMNVTPVISSGNPVSFHFIVKNYTKDDDVFYYIEGRYCRDGTREVFEPWDKRSDSRAPSITVDNQIRRFQLVNLVQCTTEGATRFLTMVEICFDHCMGVSRKYLTNESEKTPQLTEQPITQVIISNTVEIEPERCLLGPVLHVDPCHSMAGCKYGVTQEASTVTLPYIFGKNQLSMFCLEPSVCLTNANFHITSQIKSLCIRLKETSVYCKDREAELALMSIIAFLEQYGDINAKINSGMTPLHLAVEKGLIKAVSVLIQSGAAINAKNNNGDTPLYIAVRRKNLAVVALLLAEEATIDMRTFDYALDNKLMRATLVQNICAQKNLSSDIQAFFIMCIETKHIELAELVRPIKNPILRAKIYLLEKNIMLRKKEGDTAVEEAEIFVTLYQKISSSEEPSKEEFAQMLIDLIDLKQPREINLAKQVLIRVYEINPDEACLQPVLEHFIEIEQRTDIPLSISFQKYKAREEADIQKQLRKIELAYLKLPDDDGRLLHEFKILCKIVYRSRHHALDFFGTTSAMKNLAELLSNEKAAELRAVLKIASNDVKTILKLIDTYAKQKDDIDKPDPRQSLPTTRGGI